MLAFVALAAVACGAREEAKPRPLPEEERRLRPGAYRSEECEPSLSFEVGDGWTNVPPEAHDVLGLTRGEEAAFAFVNAQQVYEPGRRSGLPTVARAPEDMVGWFRSHPYLRTSEPESITVGGSGARGWTRRSRRRKVTRGHAWGQPGGLRGRLQV